MANKENHFGMNITMFTGSILAGYLSYAKFGSIMGAALKGVFLGWFYVIYYAIRYGVR